MTIRTFLRHAGTGRYFQSLNTWTPDRNEAHDFGPIGTAVKFAKKLGISGLELILDFDDPKQISNTPFQAFWRRVTRSRHSFRNGTAG
jgi:hypothetical protein